MFCLRFQLREKFLLFFKKKKKSSNLDKTFVLKTILNDNDRHIWPLNFRRCFFFSLLIWRPFLVRLSCLLVCLCWLERAQDESVQLKLTMVIPCNLLLLWVAKIANFLFRWNVIMFDILIVLLKQAKSQASRINVNHVGMKAGQLISFSIRFSRSLSLELCPLSEIDLIFYLCALWSLFHCFEQQRHCWPTVVATNCSTTLR